MGGGVVNVAQSKQPRYYRATQYSAIAVSVIRPAKFYTFYPFFFLRLSWDTLWIEGHSHCFGKFPRGPWGGISASGFHQIEGSLSLIYNPCLANVIIFSTVFVCHSSEEYFLFGRINWAIQLKEWVGIVRTPPPLSILENPFILQHHLRMTWKE